MSGLERHLIRGLDKVEAAELQTDEDMATDRTEYIRTKVRTAMDAMAQEAHWSDTPSDGLNVEPLWAEWRDAVVSVLFDMDREHAEHERNADHVRAECL